MNKITDGVEKFITSTIDRQWEQVEKLAKKSPNLARVVCPIPVAIATLCLGLLKSAVGCISEITKIPQGKIHLWNAIKHFVSSPLIVVFLSYFAVRIILDPLSMVKEFKGELNETELHVDITKFMFEEKIEDPEIINNLHKIVREQIRTLLANLENGKVTRDEFNKQINTMLTTPENKALILQKAASKIEDTELNKEWPEDYRRNN